MAAVREEAGTVRSVGLGESCGVFEGRGGIGTAGVVCELEGGAVRLLKGDMSGSFTGDVGDGEGDASGSLEGED